MFQDPLTVLEVQHLDLSPDQVNMRGYDFQALYLRRDNRAIGVFPVHQTFINRKLYVADVDP